MKTQLSILVVGLALSVASGARADIVVVVSVKSSVADLTKQQVSDIFLGKAMAFPDGKPAVPVDHAEGIAARDEFHAKVTGKSGAQLKAFWSKQVFSGKGTPPKELPGAADVKKLIAENPNIIGYIDKAALDGTVKVVFSP